VYLLINLEILDASYNDNITNKSIKFLNYLKKIYLLHNTKIDDLSFDKMIKKIYKDSIITDNDIKHLIELDIPF